MARTNRELLIYTTDGFCDNKMSKCSFLPRRLLGSLHVVELEDRRMTKLTLAHMNEIGISAILESSVVKIESLLLLILSQLDCYKRCKWEAVRGIPYSTNQLLQGFFSQFLTEGTKNFQFFAPSDYPSPPAKKPFNVIVCRENLIENCNKVFWYQNLERCNIISENWKGAI